MKRLAKLGLSVLQQVRTTQNITNEGDIYTAIYLTNCTSGVQEDAPSSAASGISMPTNSRGCKSAQGSELGISFERWFEDLELRLPL